MAKDSFGYGTTTGVVDWNRENEISPQVIEAVQKDFGDRFGSDLSLLVLEHYKATGRLLSAKDIDLETVSTLKNDYQDKVMETQGLYETYSAKFK